MVGERTALLIVRVEFEEGASLPLLVHLRESSDVSAGFESAPVVVDAAVVIESVSTWLAHAGDLVST